MRTEACRVSTYSVYNLENHPEEDIQEESRTNNEFRFDLTLESNHSSEPLSLILWEPHNSIGCAQIKFPCGWHVAGSRQLECG